MKISLLGTGLLGSAVVERLLARGHEVTVWNRSADKAKALAGRGARLAPTAAEALAAADVTLLFLADRAAIEAVLLSDATRPALAGTTLLQMGTIGPADSQALDRVLTAAGARHAECPVLGSLPEARSGALILMYGGDEALFGQLTPMLLDLGPEPGRIGAVGQAAALKLAMNQLIASETAAFAMSLALVKAHGVAVDDFMRILRGSALYAPTFDKKLGRMLSGDFSGPNFPLDHLIKDLRLFIRAAEGAGIDASPLAALEATLADVSAKGRGGEDYSVLARGFMS
ncbi:MAG: NAD(P)-dependent oxidoreductase [Halothiobacillaceae bacterium]|nr:MAG: NAD(P)-dependent oxidoreductase [Halothiobacillaceae bacterium]